jgi:signal peptidase I
MTTTPFRRQPSQLLSLPSRGLGSARGRRRALSWVVFVTALVGWWVALAPAQVNGPATYAIVEGHSMEPLLHTGDLAIARRQPSYRVGDLVMYRVAYGLVIHRIVAGDAVRGWTTRGDNRPEIDPWVVPDDGIVGRYWTAIASFGPVIVWVSRNPLPFGAICASLVLLTYVPRRRRRVAPALADALRTSTREPRRAGRSRSERAVLAISAVATLAAIALVGLLGASHTLAGVRALVALAALGWAGGLTLRLSARLYDGRGVPRAAEVELRAVGSAAPRRGAPATRGARRGAARGRLGGRAARPRRGAPPPRAPPGRPGHGAARVPAHHRAPRRFPLGTVTRGARRASPSVGGAPWGQGCRRTSPAA